jgi:proline iminopeptidase
MKKWLIGALGAALLLVVAAGAALWWFMQGPLYQPGMVRARQGLRAPLEPPAQTGDLSYWQVEPNIQLYHFESGAGRVALVVHGGPGYPTTQPWPGLEPLADRFRFVYYDQRGCGRSTRPIDRFDSSDYMANLTRLDQALGLGAQIADIERIRQLLGEEKLILIGHSFGGFLASLYAAEFPERVEALILVAPADVLVMPNDGGLFTQVRDRLPDEDRAAFDDWQKRYLDYGTIFSRSEAELSALSDAFVPYYAAALGATAEAPAPGQAGGWMVHAMYFSMGQRHDYRAALAAVTAPVLVVHGADDLQAEAATRQYADAFPNAQFHVIAGAAHFPFESQPEVFALVVETFLNTAQ